MGLPLILWNFPSKVTRILSPQVSPFSLGSTAVLALAGFIPTLLFCPHWDHSSCLGMEEGLPLSAFALGSQELYKFFPVGCNDTFDRESMFCLTQFFVKRSTWAPSWLTCLNCFLSRWFYLMAIRDDLYPPQPPMPSFFWGLTPCWIPHLFHGLSGALGTTMNTCEHLEDNFLFLGLYKSQCPIIFIE